MKRNWQFLEFNFNRITLKLTCSKGFLPGLGTATWCLHYLQDRLVLAVTKVKASIIKRNLITCVFRCESVENYLWKLKLTHAIPVMIFLKPRHLVSFFLMVSNCAFHSSSSHKIFKSRSLKRIRNSMSSSLISGFFLAPRRNALVSAT